MIRIVLALLAPLSLFAVIALIALRIIPDQSRDMMNIALGALIGINNVVFAYYFGSSKGSHDKDLLMYQKPEAKDSA